MSNEIISNGDAARLLGLKPNTLVQRRKRDESLTEPEHWFKDQATGATFWTLEGMTAIARKTDTEAAREWLERAEPVAAIAPAFATEEAPAESEPAPAASAITPAEPAAAPAQSGPPVIADPLAAAEQAQDETFTALDQAADAAAAVAAPRSQQQFFEQRFHHHLTRRAGSVAPQVPDLAGKSIARMTGLPMEGVVRAAIAHYAPETEVSA